MKKHNNNQKFQNLTLRRIQFNCLIHFIFKMFNSKSSFRKFFKSSFRRILFPMMRLLRHNYVPYTIRHNYGYYGTITKI